MSNEECEKRHRAFGYKMLLSMTGITATLLMVMAGFFHQNSQALAGELESRIRQNEQIRAEMAVKLDSIAENIREIKAAVKPVTIGSK